MQKIIVNFPFDFTAVTNAKTAQIQYFDSTSIEIIVKDITGDIFTYTPPRVGAFGVVQVDEKGKALSQTIFYADSVYDTELKKLDDIINYISATLNNEHIATDQLADPTGTSIRLASLGERKMMLIQYQNKRADYIRNKYNALPFTVLNV